MDRIKVTLDNGVADVRLNRADKMNALDPALFTAIAEDSLTAETMEQAALLGSANQIEAARANLEKRAPNWSDP